MATSDKTEVLIAPLGCAGPLGGMYEYALGLSDALDAVGAGAIVATSGDWTPPDLAPGRSRRIALPWPFDRHERGRMMLAGAPGRLLDRIAGELVAYARAAGARWIWQTDNPPFGGRLLRRLAGRSGDIRVVCTAHDPVLHDEGHSRLSRLVKIHSEEAVARLATQGRIILHVHDRSLLARSRYEHARHVIEIDHPLTRIRHVPDEPRAGPAARRPAIGLVGRLEPYKGLDDFLAVARIVRRAFGDSVDIVIAGHTRADFPLRECEALGMTVLQGFQSTRRFHARIAGLDALLLPYSKATQSGVAILGLQYGVPIFAYDVGALRNVVADGVNGRLVEPGHVPRLAEAVCAALREPGMLAGYREGAVEARRSYRARVSGQLIRALGPARSVSGIRAGH